MYSERKKCYLLTLLKYKVVISNVSKILSLRKYRFIMLLKIFYLKIIYHHKLINFLKKKLYGS